MRVCDHRIDVLKIGGSNLNTARILSLMYISVLMLTQKSELLELSGVFDLL